MEHRRYPDATALNHSRELSQDAFIAHFQQASLTPEQLRYVFGEDVTFERTEQGDIPHVNAAAFQDADCKERYMDLQSARQQKRQKKRGAPVTATLAIALAALPMLNGGVEVAKAAHDESDKGAVSAFMYGMVHPLDIFESMSRQDATQSNSAHQTPPTSSPTIDVTPSPLASPTETPTETPQPQPSVIDTPKPQPTQAVTQQPSVADQQPFTIKYKQNKLGDILGYSATYPVSAGYSPKEVQAMETCGNTTTDVVLTFDDNGSEKRVNAIASLLEKEGVGAIFFPNDMSAALVRSLRERGFHVGNHTQKHQDLTQLDTAEIRKAIQSGDIDGEATLFRPPYGATVARDGYIYFDPRVRSIASDMGKDICNWTIDTLDWKGIPATKIVDTVKANLHDKQGDVILFHSHDTTNTLEALPGVIKAIRQSGNTLCPIAEKPTLANFSKTPICTPDSKKS